VESCLGLDVSMLAREGLFLRGYGSGQTQWTLRTPTEEKTLSIGWTLEPAWEDGEGLTLRLRYVVELEGRWEDADEPIRLQTTRPHFGGTRWWFTCPLSVNGTPCTRRVGKLYLPPGGRFFGCRTCYRLTYRSAQEHDKRTISATPWPS